MLEIRIRLTHTGLLTNIAAPALGAGGGALPAGLPAGAPGGIYLILNRPRSNRYCGITRNFTQRFTGRMAAVNELGIARADIPHLYIWWGRVSVRNFPRDPLFPFALPRDIAADGNAPAADLYALPAGGTANTDCAAVPRAMPVPSLTQVARDKAIAPIKAAVGAYSAWHDANLAGPVTAWTFTNNWNAGAFQPLHVAIPVAGAAATLAAEPNALDAAEQAALLAGAPAAIAADARAAIHVATGGFGFVVNASVQTVVNSFGGGAALPAVVAPGAPAYRDPGGVGAATHLRHAPGGGVAIIDLERVFIRFVRWYLGAGGSMTNGAKMNPYAWPGGGDPICVTFRSVAGAGVGPGSFAAYSGSVIWWPNNTF